MVWTAFTTAFLWTPTMRGLFRPDISTWSVMGVQGTGRGGSYLVFPALAACALAMFYLYGRNRLRSLFQSMLAAWHGLLTLIVVAGVFGETGPGSFQGAIWGVSVPLTILIVPFAGFLILTMAWIARERRSTHHRVERPWTAIDLRALIIAVLLLPIAIVLFRIGEGIDWYTRLATASTVAQWILLAGALSNPEARDNETARPDTGMRSAGRT